MARVVEELHVLDHKVSEELCVLLHMSFNVLSDLLLVSLMLKILHKSMLGEERNEVDYWRKVDVPIQNLKDWLLNLSDQLLIKGDIYKADQVRDSGSKGLLKFWRDDYAGKGDGLEIWGPDFPQYLWMSHKKIINAYSLMSCE